MTKPTETNKLLVALIIVLAAVTAAQGFFLYRLYQSTDENTAAEAVTPQNTASSPTLVRQQNAQGSATAVPSAHPNPLLNWAFQDTNPFAEIQQMQEQMNRIFEDSFGRMRLMPGVMDQWPSPAFVPSVDMKDENDAYVIRIDVPGAEQSDISVDIEDQLLTIQGEVEETVEEKDGDTILRKERRSGQFQRTLTLPGPVKEDEMTTTYDDGVLTVEIPKA